MDVVANAFLATFSAAIDHQVEVVLHETVRTHLPGCFLASLGESFQEIVSIHVIREDVFPSVAATHEVVNGPWILDTQFARRSDELR